MDNTKAINPKDVAAATKAPLWLMGVVAMVEGALAKFAGLSKYGASNWREAGASCVTLISAAERHLQKYKYGERLDPVDQTHHLGNVIACCDILLEAEACGMLIDDRPPRMELNAIFDSAERRLKLLRAQYAEIKPRHYSIADEHLAVVAISPADEPTKAPDEQA